MTRFASQDEAERALSDYAESLVGACARCPRPDEYARALFPHDDGVTAARFSVGMSSCALFALACWRAVGLPHPYLSQPYASRIGRAVSDVVEIARSCGAWRGHDETLSSGLCAGDVILMGPPEHVAVVTSVDPRGGVVTYGAVEGGQVSIYGYAIGRGDYALVTSPGGQPWVKSVHPPAHSLAHPSTGRRLVGSASLAALLDAAGLVASCPRPVPASTPARPATRRGGLFSFLLYVTQ